MKKGIEKGFTLVEVSLVGAIFFAMVGLVTINLFKTQHKTQSSGTVNSFLADMKEQQIKAMAGDSDGSASPSAYGVHFESSSYTLFRNTYGTNNFVIALPSNLRVSTPVTGSQITFATGSGELVSTTAATIIFTDSGDNNTQKTVTLNRYGVVTSVN